LTVGCSADSVSAMRESSRRTAGDLTRSDAAKDKLRTATCAAGGRAPDEEVSGKQARQLSTIGVLQCGLGTPGMRGEAYAECSYPITACRGCLRSQKEHRAKHTR